MERRSSATKVAPEHRRDARRHAGQTAPFSTGSVRQGDAGFLEVRDVAERTTVLVLGDGVELLQLGPEQRPRLVRVES
jgi:sulfur relay (sulfurtransferase) DsrF/TusC family protein